MSIQLGSWLLYGVFVLTVVIFERSITAGGQVRSSRLGRLCLGLYALLCLAVLGIWSGSLGLDGVVLLLGLPWSWLLAFVLVVLRMPDLVFGSSGTMTAYVLSAAGIALNAWLAYQVGWRLPALRALRLSQRQ